MSNDNKGKKENNKREIRQVYLSEDGTEETSVTSALIGGSDDEEQPQAEESTEKKSEHPIRKVAIAVAMISSLFLAMLVGAALALWDSNRTLEDLRVAMFTKEVSAATNTPTEQTEEAAVSQEEAEDKTDTASEVAKTDDNEAASEESEMDDVPGDPDEYGLTISSDTEGLESVSKADEDDEIVKPDDAEDPAELADPMADYPLPFSTVDESYFTDALFIGDSRLQGFGFWSGLPATYYCATGFHIYKYESTKVVQTEEGKVPIFDAMPYDAFTKIYIKVGLNELGYGTEKNFEETYAELIAKLREYEPRAIIYVHAILPVTAEKSETDKAHNNPNIAERNAALKEFAKEQKAYFLDAGPVLSDDAGNLKPEMTSDGIHLKPEYMKIWRQYLCEHAVVIQ